jgi:hypothetical protein
MFIWKNHPYVTEKESLVFIIRHSQTMANVSAAHFIGNAKGTKGDTIMAFKKATKQATSIKIAISGTAGSGKTYSALRIAKGLGGKTALLDTEGGSASLYADRFEFDTWDEADPTGFPPEYFIRVIKAAEEAGYRNLIFDSLSHEWSGRGGCLELADAIARSKYRGNTFTAWNDVTPRHNKLVETMLNSRLNIIATMRSKSDYIITKDEKTGKTTPQKVGLASIQRDGIDYEFTIMFELDRDSHLANVGKDRTGLFTDPRILSEETGRTIAQWMTGEIKGKTPTTKNDGEPNVALLEVLSHHSDEAKQALDKALYSEQSEQKPRPEPKKQITPDDYIQSDWNNRITAGENPESIMGDYSAILQMDIPDVEDLNQDDKKSLARALFIRNKEKSK